MTGSPTSSLLLDHVPWEDVSGGVMFSPMESPVRRGTQGPTSSRVSEPSYKWILQPQLRPQLTAAPTILFTMS